MPDDFERLKIKEVRAGLSNFIAIDFETANRYRNSACAISVVRVEDGKIVDTFSQLIRPPVPHFEFTYIHGI
jgi:DNA polymerase-3 subunit epsilon